MSKLIWKAEVSDDMVAHLNGEQTLKFIRQLTDAVNKLGTEYKVGREYKDGKLKENNYA
jgi:hypothetical protein